MAYNSISTMTVEDMQLPAFHFKEIEGLYFNDLTIPNEVYDTIVQKDRGLLIEDLKKVLTHAVEKMELFALNNVDSKHTFSPWHSLFILKDIEATEALPEVLQFLKQDEEIISFYLGDGLDEFGWELLYKLANHDLPLLVEFFKTLTEDYHIRKAVIDTLKEIALHQPERKMEVQSHLRTLLLHSTTIDVADDIFIDEIIVHLLEIIGELQLTRLFPEIENLFAGDKFPDLFLMDWKTFEQQYVSSLPEDKLRPGELRTREEIYLECLINFDNDGEEDDEVLEEFDADVLDDFQKHFDSIDNEDVREDSYIDYHEMQTPYVKKDADVGRNDPCPCGSGKKYKKCCGKT